MNILSINFDHDASVCAVVDDRVVLYLEEERFTNIKHTSYPYNCLEEVKKLNLVYDEIVLVNLFAENFNRGHLKASIGRLFGVSPDKVIHREIGHHWYHARTASKFCPFYDAICIIVDGRGSEYKLISDQLDLPGMCYEAETIFEINREYGLKELYRRIWVDTEEEKDIKVTIDCIDYKSLAPVSWNMDAHMKVPCRITNKLTPATLYQHTAEAYGMKWYDSGKIMALAQAKGYEHLVDEEYHRMIDACHTMHIQTVDSICELIDKGIGLSNSKNIVLTGGYFLNCVCNYELLSRYPDYNFFVSPVPHDGGNVIGASIENTHKKNLGDIYLGLGDDYSYLNEISESDYIIDDCDYDAVSNLLMNGNIVALFQGRYEAGPRALGNRSLLFDPRNPKGKDIVNRIKKRETYRPFAASVMWDKVHSWFDMRGLRDSPYMSFAVNCWEDKIDQIPAVLHVDNTSRIQTVAKYQNKHFYNLINSFYEKTGVPMVLNTSFNLAGDTMVDSLENAIDTLNRSDLEYIFLPDIMKLVTKVSVKNLETAIAQ